MVTASCRIGYDFSTPDGPLTMKLAETPSRSAGLIISVFGVASSPMASLLARKTRRLGGAPSVRGRAGSVKERPREGGSREARRGPGDRPRGPRWRCSDPELPLRRFLLRSRLRAGLRIGLWSPGLDDAGEGLVADGGGRHAHQGGHRLSTRQPRWRLGVRRAAERGYHAERQPEVAVQLLVRATGLGGPGRRLRGEPRGRRPSGRLAAGWTATGRVGLSRHGLRLLLQIGMHRNRYDVRCTDSTLGTPTPLPSMTQRSSPGTRAGARPSPPCYWSDHEEGEEGAVRRARRPGRAASLRAGEAPGDLPQPKSPARLRDSLRVPRVHLRMPDDRPAGLRHHPDRVHARQAVRRAEEPEAVPVELSRRRRLPRGGHEPVPR